MENLSLTSPYLGKDMNLEPPAYEAYALTTQPQNSVSLCINWFYVWMCFVWSESQTEGPWLTDTELQKSKSKSKSHYVRQLVGQSVLVSGAHLGPATNFSISLRFSFRQLLFVIL
jgi:hypothetical protein